MDIKEVRINRIKDSMKNRDMTGKDLAKKSGISESGISRILSGEIEPRLKTFTKIADALKVDYVWLMGYDTNEIPENKPIIEYDRLNNSNQARLLAYYQALLDSQEDNKHDT